MTDDVHPSYAGGNYDPNANPKHDTGATFDVDEEQRSAPRDTDVCVGISSFTMMSDGSYLEGVVKDVSDGGARITGDCHGLSVGQKVDLGLVIRGEKIRYSCEIVHIEPDTRTYGMKFLSGPRLVAPDEPEARRCIRCHKTYDPVWNFCGICGNELTRTRIG